jgi:hypothetical protein
MDFDELVPFTVPPLWAGRDAFLLEDLTDGGASVALDKEFL